MNRRRHLAWKVDDSRHGASETEIDRRDSRRLDHRRPCNKDDVLHCTRRLKDHRRRGKGRRVQQTLDRTAIVACRRPNSRITELIK